jgi:four helix bundle protein
MDFKELVVWQKSMLLVRLVYDLAKSLPDSEKYGLISQLQRSAVSIPANIAEGRKRRSKSDFVQFLRIANGSAAELETLLILTEDLYQAIHAQEALALLLEVQKMLSVMINKLDR